MTCYITVNMLYGAILRYYRKQIGLSQQNTCTVYDVSSSAYSRYECGQIPIPVLFMYKLAKLVNKTNVEISVHVSAVETLLCGSQIQIATSEFDNGYFTLLTQRALDLYVVKAAATLTPQQ